MATPRKRATVKELEKRFESARVLILTDYRGLSVSEINQLRRRLTQAGVEYQVVKNTLARIAANAVDKEAIIPMLEGPTAIVFGYEDEASAAKAIDEYLRSTPRSPLKVKGGLLEREPLTTAQVDQLAKLPSRPELMAQLLGGLNSPAAGLASALTGGIRKLAYALDARRQQLEEQAGATAA